MATQEQRVARRRERRRRGRRRQAAALAGLIVAAAVAVTGVAAASRGGEVPAPTRGPLGSGEPVTLAFGGDVHFESPIRERLWASPSGVLASIAPVLRRADVAMLNLETAVTERGEPASKTYVFRAPARAFDAIEAGGVDVVSMANNHGMDYGVTGLRDSLAAARGAGVPVVGAGLDAARAYAPHRVTVNGQEIAILGATQVLDDHLISAWTAGPGTPGLASAKDEPRLLGEVRAARATSDTVVVYLHWGTELAGCPTSRQRTLARRLVDAGADVVVGSHAHVLLGGGRMGRALVHYGLGNFVFYASRELTVQSGVLEVTITGRRVDRYRWVPARISGGLPVPLSGAARSQAVRSWSGLRGCTGLGV